MQARQDTRRRPRKLPRQNQPNANPRTIMSDQQDLENNMTHVAFISLGNMGAPMAENLLKAGYTLSARDLNEVAVRRLVELGGRAAFSAYDAATDADIVITMLPNDAIEIGRAHV